MVHCGWAVISKAFPFSVIRRHMTAMPVLIEQKSFKAARQNPAGREWKWQHLTTHHSPRRLSTRGLSYNITGPCMQSFSMHATCINDAEGMKI